MQEQAEHENAELKVVHKEWHGSRPCPGLAPTRVLRLTWAAAADYNGANGINAVLTGAQVDNSGNRVRFGRAQRQ